MFSWQWQKPRNKEAETPISMCCWEGGDHKPSWQPQGKKKKKKQIHFHAQWNKQDPCICACAEGSCDKVIPKRTMPGVILFVGVQTTPHHSHKKRRSKIDGWFHFNTQWKHSFSAQNTNHFNKQIRDKVLENNSSLSSKALPKSFLKHVCIAQSDCCIMVIITLYTLRSDLKIHFWIKVHRVFGCILLNIDATTHPKSLEGVIWDQD